jgi:organic radical activating enzyme
MNKENLFVSDIFASVQGEGKKIGTPSVFLRLGICNLQCRWCDTPYTWKKGFTDYKEQHADLVASKISALRKRGIINNLVITGGEPLLQQKALARLLEDKSFNDMEIEFETNGSIPLMPQLKKMLRGRAVSFNISPKLEDSGNKPYKVNIYPRAALKFVYLNKKSERLIDDLLCDMGTITNGVPVHIMPEGVSVRTMEKKYKAILAYCARKGFIFSPRLHIYLFGNKRGR